MEGEKEKIKERGIERLEKVEREREKEENYDACTFHASSRSLSELKFT